MSGKDKRIPITPATNQTVEFAEFKRPHWENSIIVIFNKSCLTRIHFLFNIVALKVVTVKHNPRTIFNEEIGCVDLSSKSFLGVASAKCRVRSCPRYTGFALKTATLHAREKCCRSRQNNNLK